MNTVEYLQRLLLRRRRWSRWLLDSSHLIKSKMDQAFRAESKYLGLTSRMAVYIAKIAGIAIEVLEDSACLTHSDRGTLGMTHTGPPPD